MEEVTLNHNKENDVQNQDEKMEKKKVILDLLEQWKQIRKDNRTLVIKTCAIRGRKGIDGINAQVEQMKDTFVENAKIYGKKAEAMAQEYIENKENKKNVIQQYKEGLEAIQKEYEDRVKFIVENKAKFEKAEEESFSNEMDLREGREQIKESPEYVEHMKKEIKCSIEIEDMLQQPDVDLDVFLAKKKEYEELREQNPLEKCDREIRNERERREKIQDVIGMCDDTLDKCEEERKKCQKENKENKKNQLSVIPKNQKFFQKIIGNVFSKFKSAKKVVKNLSEMVQEVNKHINDEMLPAFKENVSDLIEQTIEQINEKGTHLLEKGKSIGRKTTEQLMQKAEKTLTNSIDKAKQVNEQRSLRYATLLEDSEEPDR